MAHIVAYRTKEGSYIATTRFRINADTNVIQVNHKVDRRIICPKELRKVRKVLSKFFYELIDMKVGEARALGVLVPLPHPAARAYTFRPYSFNDFGQYAYERDLPKYWKKYTDICAGYSKRTIKRALYECGGITPCTLKKTFIQHSNRICGGLN